MGCLNPVPYSSVIHVSFDLLEQTTQLPSQTSPWGKSCQSCMQRKLPRIPQWVSEEGTRTGSALSGYGRCPAWGISIFPPLGPESIPTRCLSSLLFHPPHPGRDSVEVPSCPSTCCHWNSDPGWNFGGSM